MRERDFKMEGVGRGANSKAAFLQQKGYVREAINVRFDGPEAINRNGTHLAFEFDGATEVSMNYDAGLVPFYPGDTITGSSGAIVAVVTEMTVSSGTFLGDSAAGTITARKTTADFTDDTDIYDSAGTTKLATVNGTPTTTTRKQISASDEPIIIDLGVVRLFVYADSSGVVAVDANGANMTVQFEAVLAFDSGGGSTATQFAVGDTITGGSSGATGVVLGTTIYSGAWDSGSATGVIRYRATSGLFTNNEQIDNTTNSESGVAVVNGAPDVCDFSYLYSDSAGIDDLRAATAQDTAWIVNSKVTITTEASPYTGTVAKEFLDYDALTKKNRTAGSIYKTIQSSPGNPAGHYFCTDAGDVANDDLPDFVRIPKPSQPGALYDPDTMPHFVVLVNSTTVMFGRPPWLPRLSGGDVLGRLTSGENLILNEAKAEGLRVLDLSLHGDDRLFLLLSNNSLLGSQSGDYYDLWLDDTFQTVPSDRIYHEIIVSNAGDAIFLTQVGMNLFIQMEQAQAQFGSGSEKLTAGGGDGIYNGRIREISRYVGHPTVRPVSVGDRIIVPDGNGWLHQYRSGGDATEYAMVEVSRPITDIISEDLAGETLIRLCVANATMYAIMSSGDAWAWQVTALDDAGAFIGAWSKFTLDPEDEITDKIRYIWARGAYVRMITAGPTYLAEQFFYDRDASVDSGINFDARLDRRESLRGRYNKLTDRTIFRTETTPTADFSLQVRADTSGGRLAGEILSNADYDADDHTVEFRGDLSDAAHYVGRRFYAGIRFPDLWAGIEARRVLLTRLFSFHAQTSDYSLRIVRTGRDDKQFDFSAKRGGSYTPDTTELLDTGHHEARIGGTGRNIGVWIETDTGGQFRISALQVFYEAGGI